MEDMQYFDLPEIALGQADFDARLQDGRTLYEVVEELYQDREKLVGEETMRALERWQVTRSIDDHWMEHLAEMDYLRDAIWQEGYAQKDPVHVYRQEGHSLFHKMLGEIRKEVAEGIFDADIGAPAPQMYAGPDLFGMQEDRVTTTLPMEFGDEMESNEDDGEPVGAGMISGPPQREAQAHAISTGTARKPVANSQWPGATNANCCQTCASRPAIRERGTQRPVPLWQWQEVQKVPRQKCVRFELRWHTTLVFHVMRKRKCCGAVFRLILWMMFWKIHSRLCLPTMIIRLTSRRLILVAGTFSCCA